MEIPRPRLPNIRRKAKVIDDGRKKSDPIEQFIEQERMKTIIGELIPLVKKYVTINYIVRLDKYYTVGLSELKKKAFELYKVEEHHRVLIAIDAIIKQMKTTIILQNQKKDRKDY